MAPNKQAINKDTEQYILNKSFDPDYEVLATLPVELDPAGTVKRKVTEDLTLLWEVSGSYVYIGEATPGTLESAADWRIQRVDTSTGKIHYADSNSEFDNVWDDRASLTYA